MNFITSLRIFLVFFITLSRIHGSEVLVPLADSFVPPTPPETVMPLWPSSFPTAIREGSSVTVDNSDPTTGLGPVFNWEYFDWQDAWGTVHMNTFFDGLKDPGASVSESGYVPCGHFNGEYSSPPTQSEVVAGFSSHPSESSACHDSLLPNATGQIIDIPKASQLVRKSRLGVEANGKLIWNTGTTPIQQIDNGIKYDIKNSLNNCMGFANPTAAVNQEDAVFSADVCGTINGSNLRTVSEKRSMQFIPIYEPWANETYQGSTSDEYKNTLCPSDTTSPRNVRQGVTNRCLWDIYSCRDHDQNPLTATHLRNPVSHVFTPVEVKELTGGDYNGGLMPLKYWYYRSSKCVENQFSDFIPPNSPCQWDDTSIIEQGGCCELNQDWRWAITLNPLDRIEPVDENEVPIEVDVRAEQLEDIKSYKIGLNNLYLNQDTAGFIIVDPKDFFDLKLYTAGGAKASGYNANPDKVGQAKFIPPDTCPIIGITGYQGICDPSTSNNAGCFLPVYGIGPETKISSQDGKEFSYQDFPVKWSGYVKRWSWISKSDYLENVKNRRGRWGGSLYAVGADLQDGPILMVERSTDYCEDSERYSYQVPHFWPRPYTLQNNNWVPTTPGDPSGKWRNPPDLPCIQYKQYQEVQTVDYSNPDFPTNRYEYMFVDLFQPYNDLPSSDKYFVSTLKVYGTNSNGEIDPSKLNLGMPSHFSGNYTNASDSEIAEYLSGGDLIYTQLASFDGGSFSLSDDGTTYQSGLSQANYSELSETDGIIPLISNDEGEGVIGNSTNISADGETVAGAGLNFPLGTAMAIRFSPDTVSNSNCPANIATEVENYSRAQKDDNITFCLIASQLRFDSQTEGDPNFDSQEGDAFIPTNSFCEYVSYLHAGGNSSQVTEGLDDNEFVSTTQVRRCDKRWTAYDEDEGLVASEGTSTINNTTEGETAPTTPTYRPYQLLNQLPETSKYHTSNPNGTLTWVGKLKCSELSELPACNETKLISAYRTCILEDGKFGTCEDCKKLMEENPLKAVDDYNVNFPSTYAEALTYDSELTQEEYNALKAHNEYNMNRFQLASVGGIIQHDPTLYSAITEEQIKGGGCYFAAYCVNRSTSGCPGTGTSGGHVFCLSPETNITMEDGQQKEIIDIKAGEKVMAFSSDKSKGKISKSAKVIATAITEDQAYVEIKTSRKGANGEDLGSIKITPKHKLVLASGRGVMASEIVVGDKILTETGKIAIVTEIVKDNPRIKVYNLILEDGFDGYIANGLRVYSYPLLPSMEITDKIENTEK